MVRGEFKPRRHACSHSLDALLQDGLGVGQVGHLDCLHLQLVLLLVVHLHRRQGHLRVQVPGPRQLLAVTQHKTVDVGQACRDAVPVEPSMMCNSQFVGGWSVSVSRSMIRQYS